MLADQIVILRALRPRHPHLRGRPGAAASIAVIVAAAILALLVAARPTTALAAGEVQPAAIEDPVAPPPAAQEPAAPRGPTLGELTLGRHVFSPVPGSAGGGRVTFSYASTNPQSVRVAVLDGAGARIRTVRTGDVGAGRVALAWDGRRSDGSRARDGIYTIVVEAIDQRGRGRLASLVRVDATAPVLELVRSRMTPALPRPASFALQVRLSEPGRIRVATGGSAGSTVATFTRGAGLHRLTIGVADLPRLHAALAAGAARITLEVIVQDAAGNRPLRHRALLLVPPGAATGDDPRIADERWSWPLWGDVTSYFGPRWGRMHMGVDIDGETGDVIGAAADGRVTFAGYRGGYGNVVEIDHGGGIHSLYAHQSAIATRAGARVLRGQKIGYVGSTGNSTGSHLHFGVLEDGEAVDPLGYLAGGRGGMPVSPICSC